MVAFPLESRQFPLDLNFYGMISSMVLLNVVLLARELSNMESYKLHI